MKPKDRSDTVEIRVHTKNETILSDELEPREGDYFYQSPSSIPDKEWRRKKKKDRSSLRFSSLELTDERKPMLASINRDLEAPKPEYNKLEQERTGKVISIFYSFLFVCLISRKRGKKYDNF